MTGAQMETVSLRSFPWIALAVFLMAMFGSSAVRAQADLSEARALKSESRAKKPRPAGAGQTGKSAGAKAKPRARGKAKVTQPAAESTATPLPESNEKPTVAPQGKTAETVDFDTDANDVQKLEPGLDLIQAAPRPARHRSMVPASPSPEDSVVNRQ